MLNGVSRLLSTIYKCVLTCIHLQRLEEVFGLPRPAYNDACNTGDDVPLPRYGIVGITLCNVLCMLTYIPKRAIYCAKLTCMVLFNTG